MLNKSRGLLLIILFLALWLRLYGISFEVPHPDDNASVQGAMYYNITHVTPTGYGLYSLYVWPGFTLVYLQTLLYSAYYVFGSIIGEFHNLDEFRRAYVANPYPFYLLGRIGSVLLALGSICCLYSLAVRLYNNRIALISCLFLSVSFIYCMHSQFIRPDIPATMLVLAALIFCIKLYEEPQRRYYVHLGILLGVAVATKFTSIVIAMPILAAMVLSLRQGEAALDGRIRRCKMLPVLSIVIGGILLAASIFNKPYGVYGLLAQRIDAEYFRQAAAVSLLLVLRKAGLVCGIGCICAGIALRFLPQSWRYVYGIFAAKGLYCTIGSAIAAFFIADPIFFLNFRQQIRVFLTDANFGGTDNPFIGADSYGLLGNAWWYIKEPLTWGAGVPIAILAGAGLLLALLHFRKQVVILLAFPMFYFLLICLGKFRWDRYVIILMPFVSLFAALALEQIFKVMASITASRKVLIVLGSVMVLAIVFPSLFSVLRYDYLLMKRDTRLIAGEWIQQYLPQGCRIAQEAYTGEISSDKYSVMREYSLSYNPFEFYVSSGFDYLVISDSQYRRYLAAGDRYARNAEFYKNVRQKAELVRRFDAWSQLWPPAKERMLRYHIHASPEIEVYRIKK